MPGATKKKKKTQKKKPSAHKVPRRPSRTATEKGPSPLPSGPGFDYDYIIIGSGFGGSVSAMRLAQKGYSVAVLEAGKRWHAKDFPKTNWNIFKYFWFPSIFCYGIQRLNLLNHVMIVSGSGVGGGSLVYANTLYVPKKQFFENETVRALGGEKALLPFYRVAERMLGVTPNPKLWEVDRLMQETAQEMGFGETFTETPVGVYFNESQESQDPYFGGEGPERSPCTHCGGCMVGCRFGAKNTLDKNYLYFAEKLGTTVIPETKVVDILPLSEDGSGGYEIDTRRTTGLFGLPKKKFRARAVILSAGVLGSVGLLLRLKERGRLTRLSDRVGALVRTNSESLVGVTIPRGDVDLSRGVAITSSVHPDSDTHIEPVRYPAGSDAMGTLATIMTDGGGAVPRPLKFLINIFSHPIAFLRTLSPFGFAKRSVILLVMQTLDNSIHLVRKRRLAWPFKRTLTSTEGDGEHPPTFIPVANEFARRLAKRTGGIARSSYNEVLMDVPTTAHILGGACMGADPAQGVIDLQNRVHGYQNLLVCDGSMIPANPGVNPSLSITALTEKAMSHIPPRSSRQQFFGFEKRWKIGPVLAGKAGRPPRSGR
ncbi:MAG: GMC family oxidoreductase [Leptospiraceae bacterium]|nr:GMC family oxidoreductase [Leptospiraceae bacterium]